MIERSEVEAKVLTAVGNVVTDKTIVIRPEQHLVEDLGFDSMNVASLTIALEDEFDDVLLLNDWIASAHNPGDLTVASLIDYLVDLLGETG